ncbi:MAG: lamin tail domain-containing protein [Halobacterium sp.]
MPEEISRDSGQAQEGVLSRRQCLLGAGSLGALVLGGTGAYLVRDQQSKDARTYVLQQGYLRWELTPFSGEGDTVEQFYDYDGSSGSPPGEFFATDAASRLFVYEGPVDASLVFLHGSPTVSHGGTARFAFSGLARDTGAWAVRDDLLDVDDDFEQWADGNAVVEWEWGANQTDGGAYWGVLDRDDFTISITPKTLRGVDAWTALTGSLSDPTRFELAPGKPAKLKPSKGRTQVKRANVEIMPGTDPNEFDPYATDRLTVALRPPPAGADASDWVTPDDVDPGNYSVYFGSRQYLAGQNGASPQAYEHRDGALHLEYKTSAGGFTLDSAHGYLVGKTGSDTWFRGRDTVRPGGFDNADREKSQLVVTDLNVDPDGGDRAHLANEYVEFKNDGEEPLELTGYTIKDEAGWAFYVPDGFTLGAGRQFRLHTGHGQWDEDDLYWGLDTPVWSNDGDTVIVLDDTDATVLEYTYPRR